jgi:hypothetical protein
MHVIEVGLRPSTHRSPSRTAPGAPRCLEAAGPPRWWTGRFGEDGAPVLTDERGAAAGFGTREEAVAAARELGRWFRAETVRVLDPDDPAGGLAERVPGAPPSDL